MDDEKQKVLDQRVPVVPEGPRYVVVHTGKSRRQRRAEKAQRRREKKGSTK